jgi:hypothetical protein
MAREFAPGRSSDGQATPGTRALRTS